MHYHSHDVFSEASCLKRKKVSRYTYTMDTTIHRILLAIPFPHTFLLFRSLVFDFVSLFIIDSLRLLFSLVFLFQMILPCIDLYSLSLGFSSFAFIHSFIDASRVLFANIGLYNNYSLIDSENKDNEWDEKVSHDKTRKKRKSSRDKTARTSDHMT